MFVKMKNIHNHNDIIPNNMTKKIFKEKSFTHTNKYNLSINDTKKNLINSLSKNPEFMIREYPRIITKDFNSYKQTLQNSLSNYKLLYNMEKEEKNKDNNLNINQKYINKKDTILIQKIKESNKKNITNGLSPRNTDSNIHIIVNDVKYPNPFKSLDIIKNNNFIYDEMSKNILNRQGQLFRQKILNIQKYKNKFSTKMPKIHVTKSNKIPFEIPVMDLTEDKDKKKIEISSLHNLLNKDKKENSLKLFSYYKYSNKNFPEGREQFSSYFKDNKLYVCGGLTANVSGMVIWTLSFENLEWSKIYQKEYNYNRFGHTAVVNQNKLYIYGGRARVENGLIYKGLEIFLLNEGTYYVPKMSKANLPPLRRNHIAELISGQMIIYGGITENNEILNDCCILNLNPLKWLKANISSMTPGPKIYGHTSSLVIPKQYFFSNKFNIYIYPDLEIPNCRIKQKGLYIFGGKEKEEGGISNKLWILILGQKTLKWVLPETRGKPPRPRYHHSMSFFEKGNFLIVHGGRNDNMSETSAFNDTFIFDLENFEWYNIELYSFLSDFKVLSRYGHQSAIYFNKLIIFGGMNNNNYVGSSLLVINLDFSYNYEQKSIQEIMMKELKDKTDNESKKQLTKLKNDLKKIEIGLVRNISSINLPSIK